MIGRLNHVAIAVPDLEVALAMYRDALGATVTEPRDLPEHGVTVVFVELDNSKIELLQPLGRVIATLFKPEDATADDLKFAMDSVLKPTTEFEGRQVLQTIAVTSAGKTLMNRAKDGFHRVW